MIYGSRYAKNISGKSAANGFAKQFIDDFGDDLCNQLKSKINMYVGSDSSDGLWVGDVIEANEKQYYYWGYFRNEKIARKSTCVYFVLIEMQDLEKIKSCQALCEKILDHADKRTDYYKFNTSDVEEINRHIETKLPDDYQHNLNYVLAAAQVKKDYSFCVNAKKSVCCETINIIWKQCCSDIMQLKCPICLGTQVQCNSFQDRVAWCFCPQDTDHPNITAEEIAYNQLTPDKQYTFRDLYWLLNHNRLNVLKNRAKQYKAEKNNHLWADIGKMRDADAKKAARIWYIIENEKGFQIDLPSLRPTKTEKEYIVNQMQE